MQSVAPLLIALGPFTLFGLVYFVLARAERSVHLWYWTASFLAYAVQTLLCQLHEIGVLPPGALTVGRLFTLAAAGLMLIGLYRLVGRRLPRALLAGFAVVAGWIPLSLVLAVPTAVSSIPPYLFVAYALAATGWVVLRRPIAGAGRHVTAVGTMLFAGYAACIPFLTGQPWFSHQIEQGLDLLLVTSVSIGVLMMHFEAARQKEREARDQLVASQRLDALGRMASGVAHDFGNLIGAIISAIDLVASELDSEQQRQDLGLATEAATQARALVDDLLAFSRQQVVEAQEIELDAVVTSTVEIIERIAPAKTSTRLESTAPGLRVSAAPSQVQQIVLNLAFNGCDAMPDGGELTIRIEQRGDEARIIVSDTGLGMSEETRLRVFEPFFSTKDSGTGLGLATVYGLVQQLDGAIDLESEPGRGTTFTVTLPLAREPASPPAGDRRAIATPPARDPALGSRA